jgi:hypothetical protein
MTDIWAEHRKAVAERDRTPLGDIAGYRTIAARVASLYIAAKALEA